MSGLDGAIERCAQAMFPRPVPVDVQVGAGRPALLRAMSEAWSIVAATLLVSKVDHEIQPGVGCYREVPRDVADTPGRIAPQ